MVPEQSQAGGVGCISELDDPYKIYDKKLRSPSEVASMVRDGDTIVAGMILSEPYSLLQALGKVKSEVRGVKLICCLMLGDYGLRSKVDDGSILVESWYYGAKDRECSRGNVTYIPNNLHSAAKDKIGCEKIKWAWVAASKMDDKGYFRLPSLVYEKDIIEAADKVVVEVNEKLPVIYGDTEVHVSDVDYVVEGKWDPPTLEPASPGEVERRIGEYIAELVDDGATIQLGIGKIPNAVALMLRDKKDLGVHTEMIVDSMMELYEEGVITNKRKTLWEGKIVGVFVYGSRKLYEFVNENDVVELHRGRIVNDPCTIGLNYKMVSINTALQVDLFGQVCSESIGPVHYTGTGGQADFHRGAQRSKGGIGIIALPSTAKGGKISRIRLFLPEGSKVTVGANDVDTIVTEYGVARLKGRSVRDRAKALIEIAHPDFREELYKQAREAGLL